MSVLSCERYCCSNIMCDRHSNEHGYICDECFTELTQNQTSIRKFMRSEKPDETWQERQEWLTTCEEEFEDTREANY